MSRLIRALILGPPGGGKGTIAARIVEDFKFQHLSAGDALRAQISRGTEIGRTAEGVIASGRLMPDETMVGLMKAELSQQTYASANWLLDGFPRTLSQAKMFHQVMQVNYVLSLNVPDDVIIERIASRWIHTPSGRTYNLRWNPPKTPYTDDKTGEPLSQRPDDTPEVVQKRLQTYSESALGIIDFYASQKVPILEFKGRESDVIWSEMKPTLVDLVTRSTK